MAKHAQDINFGDERPNYAERDDIQLDPQLYKDPVLRRLAESDEKLTEMIKGLDKLDELETASPIVKTAMQHELKKKAQESFLFPYDQDGFLEVESESNEVLKSALEGFGVARRAWQQSPDDPEQIAAYFAAADTVEAVQDEYAIFMQDEEP